MTEPKKSVNEQYLETMTKVTERVQASGTGQNSFGYSHKGQNWLLTLPRSVMEQKRLLHLRNEYILNGTFEAEKAMLDVMAAHAMCDGKPVRLDMLDLGDIEVLKIAYLDGLLLPLSLGGEKAVTTYMEAAVANLN